MTDNFQIIFETNRILTLEDVISNEDGIKFLIKDDKSIFKI
jgi:hypothetical protein